MKTLAAFMMIVFFALSISGNLYAERFILMVLMALAAIVLFAAGYWPGGWLCRRAKKRCNDAPGFSAFKMIDESRRLKRNLRIYSIVLWVLLVCQVVMTFFNENFGYLFYILIPVIVGASAAGGMLTHPNAHDQVMFEIKYLIKNKKQYIRPEPYTPANVEYWFHAERCNELKKNRAAERGEDPDVRNQEDASGQA